MTVLEDGTCKCDMCGCLDESTDIKLSPGWTRKETKAKNSVHPDYLHYCPKCSAKLGG